MMHYHRFWNHRPELKRYIKNISPWDYGIISSTEFRDAILGAGNRGTSISYRAAMFMHACSANGYDDSAWSYLSDVPELAIPRSGSVLVIRPGDQVSDYPVAVAKRNTWRVYWIIVRNTRGTMSQALMRCHKGNEVVINVSSHHLKIVLAALVPVITKRRSRPTKKQMSIFSTMIRCIGRRHLSGRRDSFAP